jgi:hypothetical protein
MAHRLLIGCLFIVACSGAPKTSSPDYQLVEPRSTKSSGGETQDEAPDDSSSPDDETEAPPPAPTASSDPVTPPADPAPDPDAPKLVNADFSAGLTGWTASGDGFGPFTGTDGKPHVTTFIPPKGDGTVGKLWQDFKVGPSLTEIRFAVHGGDAHVKLLRGEETLFSVKANRQNSPEIAIVWQVTQYRGETLRIMIDDSLTDPWGFISVSGFELR